MQKVAIYPKTEIPLKKQPKEILKIWKRAQGIWKNKRVEPIEYLEKTRKEWERKIP